MGAVFAKRPRLDVEEISGRPVKRRPRAAGLDFISVLTSGEAVTAVLRFAGAETVLTLEALSKRAHSSLRCASIIIEAPIGLRRGEGFGVHRATRLACRAELFAIRRAGGFASRVAEPSQNPLSLYSAVPPRNTSLDLIMFEYDFDGYTDERSDVGYGEGVLRVPSPRRPLAIATPPADDVDVARSEAFLDSLQRIRKGLLHAGMLVLDVSARRDDRLGLVSMRRQVEAMDSTMAPRDDGVGEATAAKMIEAMGGADRVHYRLLRAATRDYRGCGAWSRMNKVGPHHLNALFARSALASAHADVSTLERVCDAYCWRVFLTDDELSGNAVFRGTDEATFLDICSEAGLPPRVQRGLWREALQGLLLPFNPKYVPDDIEEWKAGDLVRIGDHPSIALHDAFVHACCARAIVARFRGDPLLCFAPEREALLRRHLFVPDSLAGSLALEVLGHLGELSDGASRVDAALAAVTSEDRLPCLAEGDKLFVAMNWFNHAETETTWNGATYLRPIPHSGDDDELREIAVRYEREGAPDEDPVKLFGVQRDYDETPIAASLLCAAAADGQNELLLRLLEAPAMAEAPLSYANVDDQPRVTALDYAMKAANVVGAAILVAKVPCVTTVTVSARRNDYLLPDFSSEQKGDMLAALGYSDDTSGHLWRRSTTHPAFEAAAAAGDVWAVRRMLVATRIMQRAARLFAPNFSDWGVEPMAERMALEVAARNGHASVVEAILSLSMFAPEFWRREALKHAVFQGHADCVEALLHGDLQQRQTHLRYIVTRSTKHGHTHILRRLRDLGYSLYVDDPDTPEMSILLFAVHYGQDAACRELCRDPQFAASLREKGQEKAIISACVYGQHKVLRVLLDAAQLSSWDHFTTTPIAMACAEGSHFVETINVLLDYGFPIDRQLPKQDTALGVAARRGYFDIATVLLLRGASVTTRFPSTNNQRNALMSCLGDMNKKYRHWPSSRFQMVELLLRERREDCVANFSSELVFAVAGMSNVGVIRLLLENGADPSAVEIGGDFTALHWAVKQLLEFISEEKSQDVVRKKTRNHINRTDAIVRLLITRGANIDAPSIKEYHSSITSLVVPAGTTPREIPLHCEHEEARVKVLAVIEEAVGARNPSQS